MEGLKMKRRELLKSIGKAGLLGVASPLLRAQDQVARATRGMATPRIKDISVIECEPAGVRLTVVKDHHRPGWALRLRLRHLYATG